jgi:hypothetical protein
LESFFSDEDEESVVEDAEEEAEEGVGAVEAGTVDAEEAEEEADIASDTRI